MTPIERLENHYLIEALMSVAAELGCELGELEAKL
jgi:hypothetical protein